MATVRIQVRRGTSSDWSTVNPVLAAGEMGVETNTRKIKVGDGSTAWNSLDYIASDAPAIGEIAQDAINDALTAGTGITKTYNDGANTITVEVNTNVIATKSYVDGEISATESYADSAVSTHNSDATNVHGIANTADLATQDYVDAAISSLDNSIGETYIPDSEKGQAGGVATLNSNTKIPNAQIDSTHWATVAYADQNVVTAGLYTDQQIANLVDGSPALLNTLNELAAAINDDANFSTTITTSIGEKVAKAGDIMTGALTLPGDPTQNLHASTKQYVDNTASNLESSLTTDIGTAEDNANAYTDTAISVVNGTTTGLANDITDLQTDVGAVQQDISTINGTLTTVQSNITTAQGDITTLQQDVIDAKDEAIAAAETYTDSAISSEVTNRNSAISAAVSSHESDTTSVHGIADTAALATKTYADGKASDAQAAAESTAATALSSHEADTTGIHGISDTSQLVTVNGTQTLTAKTLTSPKVNENVELTATATELNTLDGITASTAELNTLDGITASTAELNILDGATLSTTELNYVDGVTSAIQTQLDAKAPLASPTFTGTVTLPSGTVTSTMIADGTIVNGDINASAAIAQSKISNLTTDLAAKAALAGATFTGNVTVPGLTVSGNLTVTGTTTTVNSTDLEITDPLIYIGTGNSANANDLGLVGHFDNGTYQHTGIVRDATDGKWKLFSGVTTEPTGTIDFTGATYDTLKAGTFEGNLTGNVTGNVSGNLTGNVTGDVSGNAGTATKLATARAINGTNFDGSAAITITAANPNALTIGTGLSGSSYTGGSAVTIAIDSTVATLTGTQTLTNKTLTSPTLTTPTLGAATATNITFSGDSTVQSTAGVPSLTTIVQKSANYTLSALTERDNLVEMNSASAITLTIPLNSAVAYPVGTSIDILQTGAGQVTINGTAGVTINATPQGTANTAKLRAQWSGATLFKRATDTWVVMGDLTA